MCRCCLCFCATDIVDCCEAGAICKQVGGQKQSLVSHSCQSAMGWHGIDTVGQQLVDGRASVEVIRDDLMFNFTSR